MILMMRRKMKMKMDGDEDDKFLSIFIETR